MGLALCGGGASRRDVLTMLAEQALHTAVADAVALGQLPFRCALGECRDERAYVWLAEPIIDSPLSIASARGPDALGGLVLSPLRASKLLHGLDQRICEVQAVGVSSHKVHPVQRLVTGSQHLTQPAASDYLSDYLDGEWTP